MQVLESSKAAKVWAFFGEMCAIPHGSGNEKALSDWLVAFAGKRELWAKQDEAYNVIIKKPGSEGYGDHPPVILQSHIDMVCEKNGDKVHDFLVDPIKMVVDGELVRADGTTLGADNCLGAAMALAVLDSADIAHPPIEALFTTGEEVGMTGANALDMSCLEARTLINIDSEEEGHFVVSSAGGLHFTVELPIQWQAGPQGYRYKTVRVSGLKGGHSGIDIGKGLGNGNLLLARALDAVRAETGMVVASVSGGLKDNAIPREAEAVVGVADGTAADRALERMAAAIRGELSATDPGAVLVWEDAPEAARVFSGEAGDKLLQLLLLLPYGVQAMSFAIPGLVEASNNPGVVTVTGDGVRIANIARSSVESRKELMHRQVLALAAAVGAQVTVTSDYPAWEYRADSQVRDVFVEAFEKLYGKQPEVAALHAGLECSIFARKLPGVDILSFGPDLYDIHSPQERVSIPSVDRTWALLLEALGRL